MNKLIPVLLIVLYFSCANSQEQIINRDKIQDDLNRILNDIAENYVYLNEKNIDIHCIRDYYKRQIPNIQTQEQTILFFEYLLDEFYDSHLILNTNTRSSFRLFSPIYITIEKGKPVITNIWQMQIEAIDQDLIGAEIRIINGLDFNEAIDEFPTHCNNKNARNVREWVANKIVAGRYDQPRILTLILTNKKVIEFDLDKLRIKQDSELLTSRTEDGVGIIRINNSVGNNNLIREFDKTLDKMMDTKGLIIDLRNTVDGGNSYVARGIMGRFINQPKPYQKHGLAEQYDESPMIERTWVEYVSPRKKQYKKPLVILVGRWTGSMGEGIAIGFDGMRRAEIVGTEMGRLAGEMNVFPFKNQPFSYRLSTAKLFHINGTPREKYVPIHYVKQTSTQKDETLKKGFELMDKLTE